MSFNDDVYEPTRLLTRTETVVGQHAEQRDGRDVHDQAKAIVVPDEYAGQRAVADRRIRQQTHRAGYVISGRVTDTTDRRTWRNSDGLFPRRERRELRDAVRSDRTECKRRIRRSR